MNRFATVLTRRSGRIEIASYPALWQAETLFEIYAAKLCSGERLAVVTLH